MHNSRQEVSGVFWGGLPETAFLLMGRKADSVNWNSSNTAVAVVGANTGTATGFTVGAVNITANAGSINSNTATLNVIQ